MTDFSFLKAKQKSFSFDLLSVIAFFYSKMCIYSTWHYSHPNKPYKAVWQNSAWEEQCIQLRSGLINEEMMFR